MILMFFKFMNLILAAIHFRNIANHFRRLYQLLPGTVSGEGNNLIADIISSDFRLQ